MLERKKKDALELMCQNAYAIWKSSNLRSELRTVKPGRIRFPYFIIESRRSNFGIDVLPCITENDNTHQKEIFYITKGRRSNSVYFVKPTLKHNIRGLPDNFVLDEQFGTDVDLSYKFGDIALRLIKEIFKEENPII